MLFVFFASSKKGFSQFLNGYPTSSSPSTTISNSTIYYMDNIRAHANDVYYVSSTLDGLSLDNRIGNFTVGDRVMVIQMISVAGSTTGYFEETTVQGIYNFNNTLQVDKLTRAYTPSSAVASARVQVLKIPRFFVLQNFGVVRCHSWNGYTGGVLCFAAEKVQMDRGVFDASGTGFGPDNVNWAIKGTPGVGDNFYNGGGGINTSSNASPCITPDPDPINKILGNLGTDGDPVPSSSLPTSGTPTSLFSSTSAYDYGSPSYSGYTVIMGSAGYFPSGQKSGLQGQGGGHGGIGGSDNYSSTPGQNGGNGGNATLGGDAGKGARGGGIILMKTGLIENYTFLPDHVPTTDYDFLLAAGSNGDHGKSGGAGGKSGRGGNGGMGTQIGLDIYYSGANGGNGDYGKGGQGGDGGNGGKAGTIFLYNRDAATWNCFGTAPSPKVGSVDLSSGTGGSKGPGGYTQEITDNLATYPPSLTTPYSLCTPSGNTDLDICHCDKAMTPFRSVYQLDFSTQAILSGNNYTWSFSGDLVFGYGTIVYNRATGEVVTISHVSGNTNTYHCKFYKLADANYIFDRFSYHEHNMTTNHIVLGALRNSLGGTDFELNFYDDKNLFNAKYVSTGGMRYIFYDHSPNKVYVDTSACNPNGTVLKYGTHDSKGDDGDIDGGTPEDVPFGFGNPDSHFGFNTNQLYRQPKKPLEDAFELLTLNNNQFKLVAQSHNEKEVSEHLTQTLNAELIDLTGKVIWQRQIESNETFSIEGVSVGIYILRINTEINKKLFIK